MPNGTGPDESTSMDDSWHLWLDTSAQWKTDTIFLPDEVDLNKIPVHPPTGGWDVLNEQAGFHPVTAKRIIYNASKNSLEEALHIAR